MNLSQTCDQELMIQIFSLALNVGLEVANFGQTKTY